MSYDYNDECNNCAQSQYEKETAQDETQRVRQLLNECERNYDNACKDRQELRHEITQLREQLAGANTVITEYRQALDAAEEISNTILRGEQPVKNDPNAETFVYVWDEPLTMFFAVKARNVVCFNCKTKYSSAWNWAFSGQVEYKKESLYCLCGVSQYNQEEG